MISFPVLTFFLQGFLHYDYEQDEYSDFENSSAGSQSVRSTKVMVKQHFKRIFLS